MRLLIDKSRIKNRDILSLDRLQRDPNPSYEAMLRFLVRFACDEYGQPVPEEQAWEALLDLTMDETLAAVQSIGAAVDGLRAEAVPQPTGSR